MRKLLTLVLFVILSIALISCASESSQDSKTASNSYSENTGSEPDAMENKKAPSEMEKMDDDGKSDADKSGEGGKSDADK